MSDTNNKNKKLLVHVCCGPCSAFPLMANCDSGWRGYEVTGLFYNPNIHPEAEFNKRLGGAKELFERAGRPLIIRGDYMQNEWETFDKANARLGGDEKKRLRCEMCYRARLAYTADYARAEGFDAFTTSLLISPYQNHATIKAIADEQSRRNNVEFLYYDWRPYFREGQNLARELGIYRQKYCGCILSAPKR